MKRLRVADLFCGAGGTSTGVQQFCEASGYKLELVAVNHWDRAIETHSKNHPKAAHFCQDLTRLKPSEAVPSGKLDLLVASPECFPAGTTILCERGLIPIEDVKEGDRVLTHLGNWKPVTSVMQSTKDTVIVRGQGHYGIETTSEHPFYTCHEKPRTGRLIRPFEWTPARDLVGRYWMTPIVPRTLGLQVPSVGGRGVKFTGRFWWFVGRWLADGCVRIREDNSEITLAIGPAKAGYVAAALAEMEPPPGSKRADGNSLRWRSRTIRTAVLFETGHDGLARWLIEHFGKLADGKSIPAWLLSASYEVRQQVLAGYISGDGWNDKRKTEAQTVSRRLAVGIRLLAESLGHRVQMHRVEARPYQIEGRTVEGREAYKLVWVRRPIRAQAFATDAYSMTRVKEVIPGRAGVTVYNLSVQDDESYVADGIIVHNCTHHSNARGGKPKNDQSRASAWIVLEWVNALQVDRVLIENVPEFVSWGPLGVDGKPISRKRGETFLAFVNALKASGYHVEYRVLNAADYGAATSRRRLFLQAAKGRRVIRWPEPTHSRDPRPGLFGSLPRWRAAREVIDWGLKGESIFNRKKPLSDNTLKRIEAGLRKFGGAAAEPFLVAMNYLRERGNDNRATIELDRPLPTITSQGNRFGFIVPTNYGEREGQSPRCHSGESPLPTIVAGGGSFGIVDPFILPHRQFDQMDVDSIDRPCRTITATNGGLNAIIVPYYGTGVADSVSDPLATVTARDRFGLAEFGVDILFRMLQPHELSAAMGFPKGYILTGNKGEQVKQIGNAVEVNQARALVGAMVG